MIRPVLSSILRAILRPAIAPAAALAIALCATGSAGAEKLVTGVSQDQVAITARFVGSDILVYGAIARNAPQKPGEKQNLIVTLEGPSQSLVVRRKARTFGIWTNRQSVTVDSAPSFYSVSTTAPLKDALTHTDDLRYHISIPLAIREIGGTATAEHPRKFIDALIQIRMREGQYEMNPGAVRLQSGTLFSTRVQLPANLTEGPYKLRIFLTRNGHVVDISQTTIMVHKAGMERWLYNLSANQPALYGILSLFIAIAAGWLASAAFQLLRR